MLEFRKRKGLTQADVAELADISDRTYADIERGGTNFRIDTLIAICNALNITPNDLIVLDNPKLDIEPDTILKKLKNRSKKEKETALRILSIYIDSL